MCLDAIVRPRPISIPAPFDVSANEQWSFLNCKTAHAILSLA